MRITQKCVCGCETVLEDSAGTYIHIGGACDAFGDVFLIEKRAREWREEHRACKEKRQKSAMFVQDLMFLNWIFERMVQVHNEDRNYDYMIRFKGIIDTLQKKGGE